MAIPKELADMLDMALIEVSNHPNHQLILPVRKKIWKLLGPKLIKDLEVLHGVGLYRRTQLAILCTQYVLNIWEKEHFTNKRPQQMIYIAEQYLRKEIDHDSTSNHMMIFWIELEDMQIDNSSVLVGYAAAKVLHTALNDVPFNLYNDEDNQSLDDEYYEDWENSLCACMAYARRQPLDNHLESQRSKEFWTWYLKEAVPTAYEAGSTELFIEPW